MKIRLLLLATYSVTKAVASSRRLRGDNIDMMIPSSAATTTTTTTDNQQDRRHLTQMGPCHTVLPRQVREWKDDGLVLLKDGDELHSCEGNSDAWYYIPNTDYYMKQKNDGNFVLRCGHPGNSRIVWQTNVHVLDEERDNGAKTKLYANGDLVTKRGKVKDNDDTVYSSAKAAADRYGDDEDDYLGPPNHDYFFAVTKDGKKVQIWKGTPGGGGDDLIWEDYTQYRGCKPSDYWK